MMDKTFRRKFLGTRVTAIIYLSLFVLLSLFGFSILLLENRAVFGFDKNDLEAVAGVGAGVAALGLMTLLWMLVWLGYRAQRFTIMGTTISNRSLFRHHEFDFADLNEKESLTWQMRGIDFRARGARSSLDLALIAGDEDFILLIESLRDRVPSTFQKGWPQFCLKIAVPLKEKQLRRAPWTIQDMPPGAFLNTRRRYDRVAALAIPLLLGLGLLLWLGVNLLEGLLLPIPVAAAWLAMRFHISPAGEMERGVNPPWLVPFVGICWAVIGGTLVILLSLSFFGIRGPAMGWIFNGVLMVSVTVMILLMHKADKQRRAGDEIAVVSAEQRWLELSAGANQGETI